MPIGLYIHIPFCMRKCPYCDFYSTTMSPQADDYYLEALLRTITAFAQQYANRTVDTVYFGGGTPSLFGARRLLCVTEHILKKFDVLPNAEFTVEVNPASGIKAELSALYNGGINRLSFGVQSMCDNELRLLERPHTAAEAKQAILTAAEIGYKHISADLMLALPGQTINDIHNNIINLASLPLDHISAYLLKIEDGTPFAQRNLILPSEDETAEQYLHCAQQLELAGFSQYEISNFAKPDGQSRHNLKYWHCEEYLGIGPAAHSFINSQRFYFPADLQAFIHEEKPLSIIVPDGKGGDFEEYCMLNLRLREGLNLKKLAKLFPTADIDAMCAHAKQLKELVILEDNYLRLTTKGFLLSNSVIAEICL